MAKNAAREILENLVRIGAAAAGEAVRTVPARRAGDVPVRPGEVNPQWLTAVLCAGTPGAAVTGCEVTPVSSGTSSRFRIAVTYNESGAAAGLPKRVFAKTTAGVLQRLTLHLADVLVQEPAFYNEIRPALDIEAPRGFHGAAHPGTGRSVVLVEDVADSKGAVFLDPTAPFTRAEVKGLLVETAHRHGRMWADPALAAYGYLKTPDVHFANLDRLIGMNARSRVGMRRSAPVLPTEPGPAPDVLYAALRRSLEQAAEGPQTLLHGDAHIGNTYRTADGRMGFVDWQVMMRGSWACDVAYLITSGLAVDDRRAWERDLLALYLEHLAKAGGAAPDPGAAWLAYRRQSLYPLYIWLTTRGRNPIQPRYQPDAICDAIIARTAVAVRDLDAVGAVAEKP
ncbi:aminoglycoside phosphotransferase [Streptomyces spiroverticillatus]|uniref:Aminoglycoside phosphotransferase n=1 Tax=Streptomyces finlayi TaxID=67296 RepID=A0A919CB18_9ACTN|nr:aminoglycoside phosphotransferase family protein [Streptomyces finlayi]GHA17317.1 aminoglycoside phosphotransferase [Streptomyces spiroverticillatus]GHC99270.1 aminoglycoside phosphotransferase [Streptomyces finlayi]